MFKEHFPTLDECWIPKRVVVDHVIEEVIIKEDVKTRRLIPNILKVTLQEAVDSEGKIYRDRFWVEEETTNKYLVKGSFKKMKNYRKNLLQKKTIGFHG